MTDHPMSDEALDDRDPATDGGGLETRQMMAAVGARLFGADAELAPARIGRFEVLERLGSGGMGVVFRARDPGLGRDVAVKVIRSEREDREAAARLRQEARSLARLQHPNVVTVLDVGVHEGSLFIAMEVVDGGTLRDWSAEHPPNTPERIRELLRLLTEAAEGLAAAHRAGVVHRDVKPQNMLIGTDGHLRLADFGLACSSESPTSSGSVAGTPAYMAPEQLDGTTDARADQFSLCASFWEAAMGVRPFGGGSREALALAIATQPPVVSPEANDVPRWLRAVLERGLSKAPEARFSSIDALLAQLRRCSRPRAAFALGAMGLSALGIFLTTRFSEQCATPASDLRDVWTDHARAEVERRIASARPDADSTTFSRLAAQLDAYADRWEDQWRSACRAGAEDGERIAEQLDLRMLCLARAQRAFEVVVEFAVHDLDSRSVARTIAALDDLPDLSTCADPERLASGPPLPADPSARAELTRIEGELRRQWLLDYIEPFDESRAKLEQLYRRAEAIEYPPLMVDIALELTLYGFEARDPETHELLARAQDIAADAGLDLRAVRVALYQWDAEGHIGGTNTAPRLRLQQAAALAERIDDVEQREYARGLVAEAEAIELQREGEPEQALARMEEHRALMERFDGPESLMVADALAGQGSILLDLGRYDEAEAVLERALELRRMYPEPSPDGIVRIVTALTRSAVEQGHGEDAVAHARILPDLIKTAAGTEHPAYAAALGNLSTARLMAGDREGAVEGARRTLELMQRIHRDDAEELVFARMNLAHMLPPGSERARLSTEAVDLALTHHGAHSYAYATSLQALAADRLDQSHPEEALAGATEALAVFEMLDRRQKIVEALTTIAQALLALRRYEEAVLQSERLVDEAGESSSERGKAEAQLVRAEVLHAAGRRGEAEAALARAERLDPDGPDHADRIAALRMALAL